MTSIRMFLPPQSPSSVAGATGHGRLAPHMSLRNRRTRQRSHTILNAWPRNPSSTLTASSISLLRPITDTDLCGKHVILRQFFIALIRGKMTSISDDDEYNNDSSETRFSALFLLSDRSESLFLLSEFRILGVLLTRYNFAATTGNLARRL